MMLKSLPLWKELDARTGGALMATTGGLNIYGTQGAASDRGKPLEAQLETYLRRGIPHERMCADAVNERFPQFGLTADREALFQPDYGVLFASRCVTAVWDYAAALGVECISGFRAAKLSEGSEAAVVTADDGRALLGRSIVVAPGAWLTGLSRSLFGIHVPTRVSAVAIAAPSAMSACSPTAR